MRKNYFWIDLLKVIAAFAVIILHVCVPIVYHFENQPNWQAGNFYNSLTRFSVPVFVMISGALLLYKNEDLTLFLKKRFSRLLFPFIFWSLIYLFIKIDYTLQIKDLLIHSFKQIKKGTEFHLWYVYMLIGLYLFIPILSKWSINATKKEMMYFLSIWGFIITLNLPMINKLYTIVDLRYFSGYIGYLVLGTFLHRFVNNKLRWLGLLLFSLGTAITIITTYLLSLRTNSFDGQFYDFLGFNVVISSTGLFILCKDVVTKNKLFNKSIVTISKYSYGIYLSHVFVLIGFSKIGFNYTHFNPWLSIPIIAFCVLIISLLITFLLSKIPFVGKYIAG